MVISLFGHVVVLWMQFIARKTPHGWAIASSNRMVFGSSLAGAFGTIAIWRFSAILLDQ